MNKSSVFQFISKSDIIKIAVIVTLVFVITNFIKITALISGVSQTPVYDILHQALSLPGTFSNWVKQPWSIITFMFSGDGFLSLLFDMIWLWIFGSVIEDLKGAYRIFPIYIVGGVLGGLAFMLVGQINPALATSYYLGVLPALIAVVVATVGYKYNYTYWFYSVRLPIWVLAIVFFVLKIGTLSSYTVHSLALILGGIAAGLLYNYGGIAIFDALTAFFKKLAYWGSNENFMRTSKKSTSKHQSNQQNLHQDLDAILDKINQKGMNSLTASERKVLESYGKE